MSWKHIGKSLAAGAVLLLGVGWGPMALAQTVLELDDLSAFETYIENATGAGVEITNTAELRYDVLGTEQAMIDDSVSFRVDRVLRLQVTEQDTANIEVAQGQEDAFLTYDVTNLSNARVNIHLAGVQQGNDTADMGAGFSAGEGAFGTASALQGFCWVEEADIATIGTACVEANATSIIVDVDPGETYRVRLFVDVAASLLDEYVEVWSLVAQVANPGSVAGTDFADGDELPGSLGQLITLDSNANQSPGHTTALGASTVGIQDVFADDEGSAAYDFVAGSTTVTSASERDGQHADKSAFIVLVAQMTIEKSSRVLWDPINGGCDPLPGTDATRPNMYPASGCGAGARRIPGAIIEYIIFVENESATSSADDVRVSDEVNDSSISALASPLQRVFLRECGDTTFSQGGSTMTVAGGFVDAPLGDCDGQESGEIVYYVEIQ